MIISNRNTQKNLLKLNSRLHTISVDLPNQLILFFFVLVVTCPLLGQVKQKLSVTESDYHLWGNLYFDKLSDNGNWTSYKMQYDEHPDTLFLKSTDGVKQYKFPNSSNGTFNKENNFACITSNKTLYLLDLKSKKQIQIEGVEIFSFSSNGKFLITLENSQNRKQLSIRKNSGETIETIKDATTYQQNNEGDGLICAIKNPNTNQLLLISLKDEIQKDSILEDNIGNFTQLTWQKHDASFVFLQHAKDSVIETNTLFYYAIKQKTLIQFNPDKILAFPDNLQIPNEYASRLSISNDGQKVFFGLLDKIPTTKYEKNQIQIWNGNDKWIYPERAKYKDFEVISKVAVWFPYENRFMQLANSKHPFILLSGNQEYAITYNLTDREPQYKLSPTTDFYITDLKTGKSNLWLENLSTEANCISISPTGKYAAYFKDNNWWVYNFTIKSHTNITKDAAIPLVKKDENGTTEVYGVAGWGINENSLLYYDEYDIWEANLNSNLKIKLTDGVKQNRTYRIARTGKELTGISNYDGRIDLTTDTNKELPIYSYEGTATGYFIRNGKNKIHQIAYGNYYLSQLVKAKNNDVYVYQEEKFNNPPTLKVTTPKNELPTVLIQSNEQHFNYLWGKAEPIYYNTKSKVPLKGVLFYPAGYDPQKKYPMIVHIYQEQFHLLHRYENPSNYDMRGFNISNFTAKGYFVLLPDIVYSKQNTGNDATDCVIAATKEVISMEIVEPDKIGLIGHSFGGYETNFIITQTNLFAAAISGAGVSDLESFYLSVGWTFGRPEIWRLENQQWRMKSSLFENKQSYEENSPVTYASNVTTPLLIWSGEEDRQIHYYQSIAYYLALRRLNKKNIMLIYPGDAHIVANKEHQLDLSHRIEDWFDYFLKEESDPIWIKDGLK